ncbi:MAG: hypothetical protein H6810_10540 [Phycisphaeraceae bacterium]|nr:MAG: hypothetical protein H6810_10540 [Phycisphaeraceae bacterium]
MADEEKNTEQAEAPKKKSPLILFGVVGVLMLLEALGVYVVMSLGGPQSSQADTLVAPENEDEKITEVLLVEDRFINISTGRVWQWQATIHLRVKNKNLDWVNAELEERQAEIKEGVAEIIASAQDRHLREPRRETVKRQLTAYVNQIFGVDGNGENRVEGIVISRWLPAPLDY